jgi:hypothetical protein
MSAVEGMLLTGESYMAWLTDSMRYPYDPQHPASGAVEPPAGDFRLEMEWQLTSRTNPNVTCSFKSSQVTRTLGNPLLSEALPADKLNTVCGANHPHIPTGSETDPQDGGQSWSIPVTSWPYKGSTYGLSATFFSEGMVDPKNPDVMNLAGLSEKNSHWTHNFAMWPTLSIDETAAGWAVVHRGLHPITFKKPASGNTYTMGSKLRVVAWCNPARSPVILSA